MRFFAIILFWLFVSVGVAYYSAADAQQVSFNDALVDAADRDAESTVTQLLSSSYPVDSKGKFGVTALMRAAYRNNTKIAEKLLNVGANPNSVDIGGATALHLASRTGHNEIVKLLLKYEAFIDLSDNNGWTPLMRASLAGHHTVVKTLIDAGADVNAVNKSKETPLIQAVHKRNIKVAKILLDSGADPTHVNATGFSVLDIAKRKRNDKLENLVRTALNNQYGEKPKEFVLPEPESFKHRNLQLSVKDKSELDSEQPFKKLAQDKKELTDQEKNTFSIVQRLDNLLSSKEPKKTELAEAESKAPQPTIPKARPESLQTTESNIGGQETVTIVQGLPWVSPSSIPASMQDNYPGKRPSLASKKLSSDKEQTSITELGTEITAVKPAPKLRPYNVVAGTPWVEESGQIDLALKLKQIEEKLATQPIKIASLEDSDKNLSQGEKELIQTKTEVATSENSSTEPNEESQMEVATLATLATEDNIDDKELEELTLLEPAAQKPKTSKEMDLPESLPNNKTDSTEEYVEIQPASGDSFIQEDKVEQVAEKSVIPPKEVVGRPWLTPDSLKQDAPERIEIAEDKSIPKQNPDSISPLVQEKVDDWQEEVADKLAAEEKKMKTSTDETDGSKVEVSEAIRVPLSEAPKNLELAEAEDNTPQEILPRGFFPSSTKNNKKFWVELSSFTTERKAVQLFDAVTEREKLYLRMRLIKPALRTREQQFVKLRIGTFDNDKDAADACYTFKQGNFLKCSIVKDAGSSSPAKTAHPFRFGYERATYQNEYAFLAPNSGLSKYYWIQLGTYLNEFDAIGKWKQLRREHGDVLAALKVNLTTPKRSSSSAQSLRLRAGPFIAKADANAACRSLKQRQVSCLAVLGN